MQIYSALTQEISSRWECSPSVLITSYLELADKQIKKEIVTVLYKVVLSISSKKCEI